MIASTVPPGCPSCGVLATKVDSRRSQQVRDVPVAGAAVVVWAKRRWFCLEALACARGTFAEATEQIPRYARSTTRLRDQVVSAVIRSRPCSLRGGPGPRRLVVAGPGRPQRRRSGPA